MNLRSSKGSLGTTALVFGLSVLLGACSSDAASPNTESTPDAQSSSPAGDAAAESGPAPILHFDDPMLSTGSLCPQDGSLTYDSFASHFFGTYCTRCHGSDKVGMTARSGAPADHNFDSLAGVQRWIPNIDMMAGAGPKAVHMTMPLTDPKPSDDERRMLGAWLACREGL